MNNEHHGQLIEKIIRRNGHSITDIARLTNVNRRSVYNWFNQPRLKPCTIKSIGDAIQFDFTGIFPEFKEEITTRTPFLTQNHTDRNLVSQANYWKDKYIDLLERYTELLSIKDDKVIRELL